MTKEERMKEDETITDIVVYYRIRFADGDMKLSESLSYVMSYIPKSYKKTNDMSKLNHLSILFEKMEQTLFEENGNEYDDTDCLEEFYFIARDQRKKTKKK